MCPMFSCLRALIMGILEIQVQTKRHDLKQVGPNSSHDLKGPKSFVICSRPPSLACLCAGQ